ncbi:hypothetical protein SeLEV6574_g03570 [Synchytrium endobioticum]|nr:hypothetical protein SeLEV6574_g03570 [Synchytrium endobioticum]
MGIKHLLPLLRHKSPGALKQVDLSTFSGQTVAVDATLYAYQSLYTSYRRPHDDIHRYHISQEEKDRLLLLRGLYNLATRLTSSQNNIKPLFIFDGPGVGARSVLKALELERRKVRRQELRIAIQDEEKRCERLNQLGQFMHDLSSLAPEQFESVVDELNTQSSIKQDGEVEADDSLVVERVVSETKVDRLKEDLQVHVDEKVEADDSLVVERVVIEAKVDRLKEDLQVPVDKKVEADDSLVVERIVSEIKMDRLKEDLQVHVNELNKLMRDFETGMFVKAAAREEMALLDAVKQQGGVEVDHNVHLQVLQRHQLARHDKLKARVAQMTPTLLQAARSLLDFMNLPHYTITTDDYESELVCASLASQGLIDASLSEDTDAIVVGDGLVIQKFGRIVSDPNAVVVVDPKEARKEMELTYEQFLDMCILLGTDFSGTVAKVGKVKALALIQKHGSISSILRNEANLVPNPDFSPDVARHVFTRAYTPDQDLLSQIERTRIMERNQDLRHDRDVRQYLIERGVDLDPAAHEKRWERFPGE